MERLTEMVYDRQNRIQDLRVLETATVVGCGGTGFWTSLFLAMSGVRELILIDPDVIEESNLNRLPLTRKYIGEDKIDAAAVMIIRLREDIRLETHKKKIEKPEDCLMLRGHIFCCTDNLKSQQLVCAHCKKNKLPYQRVGYDGTILNVSRAFPLSFEEKVRDGYEVTPSWVVPVVLAAASGLSSQMYKEICLMDDIGTLHNQECTSISEGMVQKFEQKIIKEKHFGNCDDCSRRDCDDCDRIDPEDNDYGYCPDCGRVDADDHASEIDAEYINALNRDNISDLPRHVIQAIESYVERRKSEDTENKRPRRKS